MKKSTNTNGFIVRHLPSITIILLIVIWETLTRLLNVPIYKLPGPSSIIKVFETNWRLILSHTYVTVFESMVGLLISIVVGLVFAFFMSRWKTVRRILYPLMVVSQTVPVIALAPLILMWFGFGVLPKILIVVLVCFFPIAMNVTEGLVSADKDMIDLMKVMGASQYKIFKEVKLPSALPQFFSGLKIAATYSITGAVVGEWLGAKSGIGIFMTRSIASHRADMLFAAVTVVVILSIGIFKIVEIAERIIIPWNKNS
jgi:ABC-type nitrate/sulfonate/bicarbonate transport system permease component